MRLVRRCPVRYDSARCRQSLAAVAKNGKGLACVCRAWNRTVKQYLQTWPEATRRVLQLHGGHRSPVVPTRGFVCILESLRWSNVLPVTRLVAFQDHTWPLRVTSVQVSTPEYNSSSDARIRKLSWPFAAFAHQLLHDVPLPWCKCLKGNSECSGDTPFRHGRVKCGSGDAMCFQEFLDGSYLRGVQSLHTSTALLISPFGLVTRTGCRLTDRLPGALETLKAHPAIISDLEETHTIFTWSSCMRDGDQSKCAECRELSRNKRCQLCTNSREWSYLCHRWTMHFHSLEGEDDDSSKIEFSIEGRVLPFLCTSDDGEHLGESDDD